MRHHISDVSLEPECVVDEFNGVGIGRVPLGIVARASQPTTIDDGLLIIVLNDRFSIRPVYYADAGGRLLFGGRLRGLIGPHGIPLEVSQRVIAQFLIFGYYLGGDPSVAGAKVLSAPVNVRS